MAPLERDPWEVGVPLKNMRLDAVIRLQLNTIEVGAFLGADSEGASHFLSIHVKKVLDHHGALGAGPL